LDINSAWESIRDNIKTSAKENLGYHRLKHNKALFDDECSSRLSCNGCKIQAKSMEMICKIQDVKPIECLGTKKRRYLKDKINEVETNN
jgi:hypothetical protein